MATIIQPSIHLTQLSLNRPEQSDIDRELDGISSAQSPQPSLQSTVIPALHGFEDVPDGGYGWVIVAACSVITLVFEPFSLFSFLFSSFFWVVKLIVGRISRFVGLSLLLCGTSTRIDSFLSV